MNKEIFYNEHVKNTIDYAAVTNQASEEQVHKIVDSMYEKATINIFKRIGHGLPPMELQKDNQFTGLSITAANRFLKATAAALDDDASERWFIIAKWHGIAKPEAVKAFVGDIVVNANDRSNNSIVENKIVDMYIQCYDKKLEHPNYGAHDLDVMLKLPEIRSFMLEQAKEFIKDVKLEKTPKDNIYAREEQSRIQSVWMLPGDHGTIRQGVARKGGR